MAKRGSLTHRRTRRLAAALGIHLPYALGLMEAVWHTTADRAPRGDLGRLTDRDIADEIWWPDEPARLIAALVEAGVLDTHPQFRLVVHGWSEHADDAVRKKLARARQVFADGSAPWHNRGETRHAGGETEDSGGNPPEPEPVPEPIRARAKPSQKQKAAGAAASGGDSDEAVTVLAYWQQRTKTMLRSPKAREEILARLRRLLKGGCSADDLRACVDYALVDEFYVAKGYSKKPDVIWRSAERVSDLATRWAELSGAPTVEASPHRDGPSREELAALDAEADLRAGAGR